VCRWLVLALFAALPLLAADFWETKKYTEWSDKEVKKMLSDSPWAATITTGSTVADTLPNPPGMSGGGGSRGGGGGGGGGGDMGGGGGDRGGGGGGRGGGAMSATIRWATALPVKQALMKQRAGERAGSPEAVLALSAPTAQYVIILEGVRSRVEPEQLKTATKLNRKGKPSIVPEKVDVQRTQQGTFLLFYFPKTDPLVLEDKEVEFVVKVGQVDLKHKFKLKDMVFGGNLAI